MSPNILVIGYGNELRGDDGVGPKLAAAIEQLELEGVQVKSCHQLTPELAEPVSTADAVVFLDASCEGLQEIQIRSLVPAGAFDIRAHRSDPAGLLGVARDAFGKAPPAWWITVPIQETEFGDRLSAFAQEQMTLALEAFKRLHSQIGAARFSLGA